jgi:hypothetical protein
MATKVTFTNEGRAHSINSADDKAVRDAMQAQAGLTDRYIKIEPAISAAFGAPDCYQKKTENREDLLAYLKSRHPGFSAAEAAQAKVEAAKAKGDPETANKLASDSRYLWGKIDSDVANAIRAMKKYHEAGSTGERKQREEKSPRQLAQDLRVKLDKIADNSDWPDVDRKLAKALVTAITGCLGDGAKMLADAQAAAAAKAEHPERAAGKVTVLTGEAAQALVGPQ